MENQFVVARHVLLPVILLLIFVEYLDLISCFDNLYVAYFI